MSGAFAHTKHNVAPLLPAPQPPLFDFRANHLRSRCLHPHRVAATYSSPVASLISEHSIRLNPRLPSSTSTMLAASLAVAIADHSPLATAVHGIDWLGAICPRRTAVTLLNESMQPSPVPNLFMSNPSCSLVGSAQSIVPILQSSRSIPYHQAASPFLIKCLKKNVVSRNAMISGYSENGNFNEAHDMFQSMLLEGKIPPR